MVGWFWAFCAFFGAVGAFGAAHPFPVLYTRPSRLEKRDNTLFIRPQKTAGKTVESLLLRAVTPAYYGPFRSGNLCGAYLFSTSDVPLASEVASAGSEALKLPYERSRVFRAVGDRLEVGSVLQALDGHVYSGAAVPGRAKRRCANFDEPWVLQQRRCYFTAGQHVHFLDLLNTTASMNEARNPVEPLEQMPQRIVGVLRDPVRRVLSEAKHIGMQGRSVWDYCSGSTAKAQLALFRQLPKPWKQSDAEQLLEALLEDEEAAFGMRNRQVKMFSGLAVPVDSEGAVDEEKLRGEDLRVPTALWQGMRWHQAALYLAKAVVVHTELLFITERMPESIALAFHRLDFIPNLPQLEAKEPQLYVRLWNAAKNAPESQRTAQRNPTHRDQGGFFRTKGLTWDDLLRASNALLPALTEKEDVDLQTLPIDPDDSNSPIVRRIRANNKLDTHLFHFANAILSARIEKVKQGRSQQ